MPLGLGSLRPLATRKSPGAVVSWGVGGLVFHTCRDGRLRLRLNVAESPELAGWVPSFAAGARVAAPASLREAVRVAADRIVHNSTDREVAG